MLELFKTFLVKRQQNLRTFKSDMVLTQHGCWHRKIAFFIIINNRQHYLHLMTIQRGCLYWILVAARTLKVPMISPIENFQLTHVGNDFRLSSKSQKLDLFNVNFPLRAPLNLRHQTIIRSTPGSNIQIAIPALREKQNCSNQYVQVIKESVKYTL